ncbi:hypothetical protein GW17_00010810 [Ensete ventricosum]|nr:hypothetical protein GW17_00010810 [Ensete ventricosum]
MGGNNSNRWYYLVASGPCTGLRLVTVDFDRRWSILGGISRGRKKKREKKKREKKRENLEIRCCSPDPDHCSRASPRFAGRIFDDRGKKKTTFLLLARASY